MRTIGISLAVVAVISFAGLARSLGQSPMPPDRSPVGRLQQLERDVEIFKQAAAKEPTNPSAQHAVATAYLEMTKDATLSDAQKRVCIERAIAADSRALEVDPNFAQALIYKNLLLRLQSEGEANQGAREALIREADVLRARAARAAGQGAFESIAEGTVVTPGPPPPPPPPPPGGPGRGEIQWVYAETAYRALGARPAKTRDVRPIYAPMVIASGIKGDVVVEATVDARGTVSMLRVVRTLPMLTQATLDAVSQWEFDPATVRGAPIVVTVTASFTPPTR
jgi:TonB family protein